MHNTKRNDDTSSLPFHFQFLDDPKSLVKQIYSNSHIYTIILEALKQHEPFSYVFLTKVNKRKVPLYYEIIKNPMDLGTMSKKKYATKEAFKQDLDLIWDNCVYFNGQSIFSEYAEKMRTKANELYELYFGQDDREYEEQKEHVVEEEKTAEIDTEQKENIPYNQCEYQEIYNFDYLETKKKEFVKVESLDNVIFDYKNIKVGKKSFFNNQFRSKKSDISINEECAKSIIEQIILILLHKIGYKKIQRSAITLFRDVAYHQILKKMKNIGEKEWLDEINDLKISDLNIHTVYDKQNETTCETQVENESKSSMQTDINYNIL
ncbi:Transcriptional activator spt7 [Binucleata daphniae]